MQKPGLRTCFEPATGLPLKVSAFRIRQVSRICCQARTGDEVSAT